MKSEYDTFKSEVEGQKAKNAKTEAYKKLLRDSNIAEKYIDKITRLAEIDKLELDKDGNIKDAESIKKSVETDWSDFIATEKKRGADVKTPPAGGDDEKTDTKYASDRVAKYMAERYGEIKKD